MAEHGMFGGSWTGPLLAFSFHPFSIQHVIRIFVAPGLGFQNLITAKQARTDAKPSDEPP